MTWSDLKTTLLIVGLVLPAVISGCASGGSGAGVEEAQVPEEAEQVAEEPEDDHTRIWNVTEEDEPLPQEEVGIEEPEEDPAPSPWDEAIFWYSRASLAGDAPPGLDIFSFMLSSTPEPKIHPYVGLYYGKGGRFRGRELQDTLRWVTEAGFEVGVRYYVTSDTNWIGLFGMLGLRAGGQFWSYTQAIEATDQDGDTDTYSHDAVIVATPYLGVGISILQQEELNLGVSASAGYRLHGNYTYHDIEEGLFRNVWEFKLNFEVILSP